MATKKPRKETKPAKEPWIKRPIKSCQDKKCPFHGTLRIHGRVFEGKVIKDVFHKTASIEFSRQFYLPKYERYEKRRTRLKVHVSPCLEVSKGNVIKVAETRPISKMKTFVTIEVIRK